MGPSASLRRCGSRTSRSRQSTLQGSKVLWPMVYLHRRGHPLDKLHALWDLVDVDADRDAPRETYPREDRPMAALTRSGARKASETVMLIFRALQFSCLAMLSVLAVGSVMSSSSQRRPRAIDTTNLARVSERIGRATVRRTPAPIS